MLRPTIRNILNVPLESNTSVSGWIKKLRKQKQFWFAEINDGSVTESLQAVIPSRLAKSIGPLSLGASLEVTGKLTKSSCSTQKLEIFVENLRLLGSCPGESYPIQKLNNSSDFMRANSLHFRLRSDRGSSIARLKSELFSSLVDTLRLSDFIRIFPPILTEHDCEGGGEVFRVEAERRDFFSKPVFLTVSTQLHLEMAAAAFPRVYSLSPVFRAENQHTTKHLSEFWMLECEISFLDHLDNLLGFIEQFLKLSAKDLLERSKNDCLDRDKSYQIIHSPFAKITYTDAVKELSNFEGKFIHSLSWGKDLQTEHEKFLAEEVFKGPVFVTDYPANLKPFYMKSNNDGKTVSCLDLLVPGIGEIVGGSLREDNYDKLKLNIHQKIGTEEETPLQWYLDLRKFGSVPHGGFGLGFDRFLQFLSGTNNIRDTVMIPRYEGSIKF